MHFEKKVPHFIDLGFRPEAIPSLQAYLDFLWKTNAEYNLISRQMSQEELMDNHVIDCMLPLQHFPRDKKNIADFGSGGGLPGVLYALQFPEIQFHLFEKSKRKQDFLRKCMPFAPNIHVHFEIPLELKNIDLVIARAFKPIDVILDMSRNYFKNGGQYFLLKGRKEKIEEEFKIAQKKFKELKIKVDILKSPVMDVERHLVRI